MKKKVGITFISIIGLLLSSCSVLDFFFGKKVESVSISNKIESISLEEEYKLNINISPIDAKNPEILYKSSAEDIASINESGVIAGLKLGSTIIEAISKQNESIKDSFELKVVNPTLTSIEISKNPTRVYYVSDETFDPKGLVINAHYSNNETKEVSYETNKGDFSFTPSLSTALTSNNQSVTVKYKDVSTTLDIEVNEVTSLDKTSLTYTYDDYNKYNAYTMDNCPLKGNPKLLIIPIWFNDSSDFITEEEYKVGVREDIEKAYVGSKEDTGWHSIKTYYETESEGAINLTATVTDWYKVNKSYVEFGPESKIENTTNLVVEASDYYFNNHLSDNRSNYDSNNDGYLDGVMLIYAAPDYDSLMKEEYKNLWAYCNWTQNSASLSSPTANAFFWASYDFMYGRNAPWKTGTGYARGFTENGVLIDAHCFIHEMGHVFGLFDYYDYSEQYNPSGGFSMQDMNVGGHDPYSVMAYGWAKPYIPDKSMTISIGDFQSTHDVILLANHQVNNSPFDEYLLLEYYTPTGLNEFDSNYAYRNYFPRGPKEGGIRLWHIDARLFSYTKYKTTTKPSDGQVYHMMSNSYSADGGSIMGEDYFNYNILQLIRNDVTQTYTPINNLKQNDLFMVGDNFDMSTFSSQFVHKSKMNDEKALGWSFRVDALNEGNAIITLTKH